MPLANHYLHVEKDAERILELKSTALAQTEAEQRAFRKACLERAEFCAHNGIAPERFATLSMMAQFSVNDLSMAMLSSDTKNALKQVGQQYMAANGRLRAALAAALKDAGIRTADMMEDPQLCLQPPTGYVTGHSIVMELMIAMERQAMLAAQSRGDNRGRG
jgi:hypothetical protein